MQRLSRERELDFLGVEPLLDLEIQFLQRVKVFLALSPVPDVNHKDVQRGIVELVETDDEVARLGIGAKNFVQDFRGADRLLLNETNR